MSGQTQAYSLSATPNSFTLARRYPLMSNHESKTKTRLRPALPIHTSTRTVVVRFLKQARSATSMNYYCLYQKVPGTNLPTRRAKHTNNPSSHDAATESRLRIFQLLFAYSLSKEVRQESLNMPIAVSVSSKAGATSPENRHPVNLSTSAVYRTFAN